MAVSETSLPLADAPTATARAKVFPVVPVALLAPMMLVNLIAFILPVAQLVRISFLEGSGGVLTDTTTIGNYVDFLTDAYYLSMIWNSVLLAFVVTVLTLLCAYPIAMFLHTVSPRWRNLLFVMTISPLLVSSVVRTYGWMVLLGDQGLVNNMLVGMGLIASPLRLVNNTLGVVIGLVEILMPYMALSLIAGFGRLDASLSEAAASLGAGRLSRFRRVTLPLTLPGVALGCLLCFVLSISSFITPKLLGGGRVFLLATEIYDQAVIQLEWPLAATISVAVLVLFGFALAVYSNVVRRFD
ncbi:polyamine ABC transporter permease [Skermanella stibiiresistens SB22]|uniref:Polyamine ABC transporter permease n=1 Tax=Skermanella stibiiresistens SB22 TaxID=1385369 RepID=W9H0T1_9PROT|nr:ABC transporter permease [Skermanella stibiiresistens]EWY38317.1 polyamine ABC transporter permease [Skermanella stibiiresistens SB22]